MSKTISELNALCDVLSCMRKPTALDSSKQMYKHFCKPGGTGTVDVVYEKNSYGKIFAIYFKYTIWLGVVSKLTINTKIYY